MPSLNLGIAAHHLPSVADFRLNGLPHPGEVENESTGKKTKELIVSTMSFNISLLAGQNSSLRRAGYLGCVQPYENS